MSIQGSYNRTNKMQNLDRRRWLVLIASCVINLCIGSLYAWSVFAVPLAEKLSLLAGNGEITAANLAVVFTVANSVGPITMISGGFINDKIGPKWILLVGGILFGGGMFASGGAENVQTLVVTYGLGCGLGMGMAYGCTINNSVKFFPDKRGLIGGIATATYGLSSVIIPPIANLLIRRIGISSTFMTLGIAFTLLIGGGAWFVIKCPERYCPEGYTANEQSYTGTLGSNKNWKQMISDPIFYLMLLMLLFGAFSGLMITSQASSMAQTIAGMRVGMAATAVSILALFNAMGRVAAGYLSDKLGRITVLVIAFLLELVGLMLLLLTKTGDTLPFMVGISMMGSCFGAFMGVYPGFTADQFGTKNNSVNYGIMFIGFALAGVLGPTTAGKIVSESGAYTGAFYLAGVLAAAGLILITIYKKVKSHAIIKRVK